jgi:hypothetical protein
MKIFIFIFFFISLLIIIGCREQVLNEFPDFEQIPTVNSILTAGEALTVHVSMTGKMDTVKLQCVDNANIQLFIDGHFKENLAYTGEGNYLSTEIVKPLATYQCLVDIPGNKTITCFDSVPQANSVYNISMNQFAGKDDEGENYSSITFSFKNDSKQKNYYEVKLSKQLWAGLSNIPIIEINDPILLSSGLPKAIFSNELIKGDSYTMMVNYMNRQKYPIVLEVRSISHDYYLYIRQLYLYNIGRYPEFGNGAITAFPLFSNIQDGYGIFAGYSFVDTLISK